MQISAEIEEILFGEDVAEIRELLSLNEYSNVDEVVLKFKLFNYRFNPDYFKCNDAPFHGEIDRYNAMAYLGQLDSFVDIAFRGAAKSARTKMFLEFVIANDRCRRKRYIKILSADDTNAPQIVTDIYNFFCGAEVKYYYPEVFAKTPGKREERMESFTTATGIKVVSITVGKSQRGALQVDARPDFIWCEDFETRKTLRSALITQSIWDNLEEARTGLAVGGAVIYTCNYVSEAGNVHKLVKKRGDRHKVLIVPIEDKFGNPAWPEAYPKEKIDIMRGEDEDFEGERLCSPRASREVFFNRDILDAMPVKIPLEVNADFRIYAKYNPAHRYAGGHDVAGGVGLDSSTSVFIDFSTVPAQVVGVYDSNLISPASFGHEIAREAAFFGGCLVAPERNYSGEPILVLRQLDANIYFTEKPEHIVRKGAVRTSYGWHTNALTSPQMLNGLRDAIEDGLLVLNDEKLIEECKGFTRNDTYEIIKKDPRLTTRHFDLLIACAIAWQMNAEAKPKKENSRENFKAAYKKYIEA